ncbi:hypothetical protein ACQ4PT_030668 [Festuca glaucescens]
MADKGCLKRLQKEYHALCKEPPPQIVARPLPNDILEWHFVLEGSVGTPFEGGYYYGKLKFPSDYPFKPPSISMTTPSGRFAPHKRICLSMSDFHPESWNPMWSVARAPIIYGEFLLFHQLQVNKKNACILNCSHTVRR